MKLNYVSIRTVLHYIRTITDPDTMLLQPFVLTEGDQADLLRIEKRRNLISSISRKFGYLEGPRPHKIAVIFI